MEFLVGLRFQLGPPLKRGGLQVLQQDGPDERPALILGDGEEHREDLEPLFTLRVQVDGLAQAFHARRGVV